MSQTFAWVAGFSNYITSIVFVLIYLFIIRNIFENEVPNYNKWVTASVFPLGFITQLFVEHITIYAVFMSLFIVVYSFFKHRKINPLHVTYFVSTIIGAIVMFSNGAYSKIIVGNDGYRSVHTTEMDIWLIFKVVYNVYTERMYQYLFLNNIILNIFISAFCILLILKCDIRSKSRTLVKIGLITTFIIYPLYKPFLDVLNFNFYGVYANDIAAIFSLEYYFSIMFTIFLFMKNINLKYRLLFYLVSAGFLAVPLLFVNPFGPRNFIAPYTLLVMAVIGLGSYTLSNTSLGSIVNKLSSVAVVMIAVIYGYVFTLNGIADQERLVYLKQRITENEKAISVSRVPYEQFLWMSTPDTTGFHNIAFKKFYGIPVDTELKIIPYKQ